MRTEIARRQLLVPVATGLCRSNIGQENRRPQAALPSPTDPGATFEARFTRMTLPLPVQFPVPEYSNAHPHT
jgi:hypothetical protein